APGDGLGVKAGEAGDPVVLVDDDVAGAQVGEAAQHPTTALAAWLLGGAAALEEAVVGDAGQRELGGEEAVLQPRRGHRDLAGLRRDTVLVIAQPACLEATEVVGEA